jgi:hypothetical protein
MKNHFPKSKLAVFIFACSISLFNACSKDSTVSPSISSSLGDLKVSVHFTSDTASSYSYYLKNDIQVNLTDLSNSPIATQFTSGNSSNLDFGNYAYGNYFVKIHGDVWSSLNGNYSHDHYIDSSKVIAIDAPTKNITFVVK